LLVISPKFFIFTFSAFFINYVFKQSLASFCVLHKDFDSLNAELNPICHFLALLGAHPILHISRIRVNILRYTLKQTCVFVSDYINVANLSNHKKVTIFLSIQKVLPKDGAIRVETIIIKCFVICM
jgi:hypothetical protein